MTKGQKESPSVTETATKKNKSHLEILREAVLAVVDVVSALKSISCRFHDQEVRGVKKLQHFAKKHAEIGAAGGKPNSVDLERTIRLANQIADNLEDRFESIMRDSFVLFDKGMESIRKSAPEIIVRDGDKIHALQQALRDELNRDGATHDDIITAYKAMMDYLPEVSAEAEKVVRAERERQQQERRTTVSQSILDELDALDLD